MIFLDTDVMVDILRGYEPAIEWLKVSAIGPASQTAPAPWSVFPPST